MKKVQYATLKLDNMVNGGQAIGEFDNGKKCFVWGGLPGELVKVRITKKKSNYQEGVVEEILAPSKDRISPKDPISYLSTSPWQIMSLDAENAYKSQLINDSFRLHHVDLAANTEVYCDNVAFGYRNKVEFSWYGEEVDGKDSLDLAFYKRGSKGKVKVNGTSLAAPEINILARQIRDILRSKQISARQLKTLLVRSNRQGECVWQIYTKEKLPNLITPDESSDLAAQGGEIIYSDPKSPASKVTEKLASFGNVTLTDRVMGVPFSYACEGFFQVNLPVYEEALKDMASWIDPKTPTVDLYSGVGTIGLTIGSNDLTLVEINEFAVTEMERNIEELGKTNARAVLAPSEKALEHISSQATIIVDPPRAGLHSDVVKTLLNKLPPRIVYLSCNPVTQARDAALLTSGGQYKIAHAKGYNFFPRTPHIENLIILDKII